MRYAIIIATLFLGVFFGVRAVQATEPVRVLCFNVLCSRWDKPEYSWEKRKETVLDVMKNPEGGKPYDFIGTQEVNRDPQKPELEQLQYLADGLPEFGAHYTIINGSFDRIPHSLVDLILYRKDRWELDPEDQGHFWMSDTPEVPGSNTWEHKGDVARCMGYGLFHELGPNGRTGRNVYVYNTHLNSRSEENRIRSILLIMDRISKRKRPEAPVIVTGDFNSKHETPHIRYLQGEPMEFQGKHHEPPMRLVETFRFVHPSAGPMEFGTAHEYKGKNQGYKIDFIFTTPPLRPVEAKVIDIRRDGLYPSDHYPIEATLQWEQK